ncbi:MAG: L-threonylcarbamoyladenylate synthase [Hyphomicrobium sp.]
MTAILTKADAGAVAAAARHLAAGHLVAFPTETVYGLGADATNGESVARIFAAKGRPSFNPLIVHVLDVAAAERLAVVPPLARRLAATFWPGPLTLVLTRRSDCAASDLVSAGLDTIALRAPDHPVARALIAAAGLPIAAPSANRSGHVSSTRAEHVAADLGDSVAMILDAGPAAHGLESTVLDARGEAIVLLRPGAIPSATIEAALGIVLARPVQQPSGGPGAPAPHSPGQLESHYAPRARVRLDATTVNDGEALLAFGQPLPCSGPVLNLSPGSDTIEAAANLFAALRALDATGAASIAVMPIPMGGLGEAINDRLRRAAVGR